MDTSSCSVLLSEMRWGKNPAIHWTLPPGYLVSEKFPDLSISFGNPATRFLTEVEERLILQSLFDSGEMLYEI
jgi:hypothetical protein